MSRLMSVALTTDAVRERRKTVTRRLGWKFLEPGDRLVLCEKTRGVPKAERVELAEVEVVDVRREPLHIITYGDVCAEGFGDWQSPSPNRDCFDEDDFIDFFMEHMGCTSDTEVTRIEWRYLDEVSG